MFSAGEIRDVQQFLDLLPDDETRNRYYELLSILEEPFAKWYDELLLRLEPATVYKNDFDEIIEVAASPPDFDDLAVLNTWVNQFEYVLNNLTLPFTPEHMLYDKHLHMLRKTTLGMNLINAATERGQIIKDISQSLFRQDLRFVGVYFRQPYLIKYATLLKPFLANMFDRDNQNSFYLQNVLSGKVLLGSNEKLEVTLKQKELGLIMRYAFEKKHLITRHNQLKDVENFLVNTFRWGNGRAGKYHDFTSKTAQNALLKPDKEYDLQFGLPD